MFFFRVYESSHVCVIYDNDFVYYITLLILFVLNLQDVFELVVSFSRIISTVKGFNQ